MAALPDEEVFISNPNTNKESYNMQHNTFVQIIVAATTVLFIEVLLCWYSDCLYVKTAS
jgi:hypothetical protein